MTPLKAITEYYPRIDNNDVDWVVKLFADDAKYLRADSLYSGIEEIEQFFRHERKIRGVHEVHTIQQIDNLVFSRGEFIGKGAEGDERRVGFADFWIFDDDGLVERRETYLATGHEYVKE